MLKHLLHSWNPNKYHLLQEMRLTQVHRIVAFSALLSIIVCVVLLIPALTQLPTIQADLVAQTSLNFNATLQQQGVSYIAKNPDIIITTGAEKGFITITPEHFSIKKYFYFGSKTYPWSAFSSLESFPVRDVLVPFALFLIPSILFWGYLFISAHVLVAALMYSAIASLVTRVRALSISYLQLWKITLYATIPSLLLFGLLPILRIGLPLVVIFVLMLLLWLILSVIGTALCAEKQLLKAQPQKPKGK